MIIKLERRLIGSSENWNMFCLRISRSREPLVESNGIEKCSGWNILEFTSRSPKHELRHMGTGSYWVWTSMARYCNKLAKLEIVKH